MSKTQKITLRKQIEAYRREKEILDKDCFYFYDWFCQGKSLEKKAMTLMPKVIRFTEYMEIDLDRHYVLFKNNCPIDGILYDDFRICNIANNKVIYTVVPSSGHSDRRGKTEVWCMFNDFREPLYTNRSWGKLIEGLKQNYNARL